MFIIGFILANRCSVKSLKVKVKKMTEENLSITKKCYESSFIYARSLSAEDLFWLLQEELVGTTYRSMQMSCGG